MNYVLNGFMFINNVITTRYNILISLDVCKCKFFGELNVFNIVYNKEHKNLNTISIRRKIP